MVLYLYIFFGGFEVTAQVACQPRATRKSSLYMHAMKTKNSLISTSNSVDLVISQTQKFFIFMYFFPQSIKLYRF